MCTNLMLALPNVEADGNGTPSGSPGKLYVSARCMEMPGVIEQSLYVVGAGQQFPLRPSLFELANPLSWTASQDFVGIAPSGTVIKQGSYSPEMVWDVLPTFNDGINLAGLSIGGLWLAPGTDYPSPGSTEFSEVSYLDFPAWVLGTCTTAAEVADALTGGPAGGDPQLTVVGPPAPNSSDSDLVDPASRFYVPLHYVITDAGGASIIVEFVDGQVMVHDSTNGVMANAPTYHWQVTNAGFYQHLSPLDNPTSKSGEGRPGGSNFTGLPGDPTSPSRFLKAWCQVKGYGDLPEDGSGWLPAPGGAAEGRTPGGYAYAEQAGVTAAQQLVQICMGTPYGMLVERREEPAQGLTYSDFTMWTSVRDHTNKAYYFVGAFSGLLTKIDLTAIDFGAAPAYPANLTVPVLPQPGIDWCVDATSQLAPASGING